MDNFKIAIILGCATVLLLFIFWLYSKAKRQVIEEELIENYDELTEAVKRHFVEVVFASDDLTGTDEEYKARKAERAKANEYFKNATFGIPAAKVYTREVIKAFIKENVEPYIIDQILGLDPDSEPSDYVKFVIILFHYEKDWKNHALAKWIDEFELDRPKSARGVKAEGDVAYYITRDELKDSYNELAIKLTPEEKTDVLSRLVFADVKGFGKLTFIQEQMINGYNVGVSGSVLDYVDINDEDRFSEDPDNISKTTNSLWIYFGEKYIHLKFFEFDSPDEIKRCIQRLIRYNAPGALTEKRGTLSNSLYDQSRVMAVRNPVGETWAAFVRKCAIKSVDPTDLIYKDYVHNAEIIIKLLQYIQRSLITTAVTGRAGCGKTTLMKGLIAYYDPRINIRTIETVRELFLRELYPDRNIYEMCESPTVSAARLGTDQKKMDSGVATFGEIASDEDAGQMVQLGMTGTECLLFSHHANTTEMLVKTLRNALLKTAGFDNATIAEIQVTTVVRIDVHLDYFTGGKRYISRVTEIIQLNEGEEYPEYDGADSEQSAFNLNREYYRRQTDRPTYITKDIIRYNIDTDTYEPVNEPSAELMRRMHEKLPRELWEELNAFLSYYWRGESINGYAGVTDVHRPSVKETEAAEQTVSLEAKLDFLANRNRYGFTRIDDQDE